MGEKRPENGNKMGFGVVILFIRHFGAIFPPFQAEGHLLVFGQFFPIFEFRPIFLSIPGGLTRKVSVEVHSPN